MISVAIGLPHLSPIPSSPSAKFPSSVLGFLSLRSENGRFSSGRSGNPAMAITCSSSPPGKKKPPRRSSDNGGTSEALELVRTVLRKTGEGNQPLIPTLNHYVRILRTEHCFLIFEELGKQDRWLQCLEVFRWMQKQRWYVADNGIYSKLISVMGKRGQTRTAMWLFSEMRSSGCRPDTSVYNALISAHLRHRDRSKALAKAWNYFEKMKSMDRCQPNSVTYNILLRALAQAGDTQRTEQLFLELDAINGADSYTFNGVMDAYGKNGMIKEMEATLRKMKIKGIRPDAITFNLLIDAYGKKQAFEKMEQVFRSLLKSKEKPTLPTFNSMILSYGKARMREKVEWVFRKMLELGYKPSLVTNESLIAAYGLCAEVGSARKVFDGMLESGFKPEASTLNAMLEVYCSNGLVSEADLMMEEVVKDGVLPNASSYRMLYKAFARASKKDLILKLLNKAIMSSRDQTAAAMLAGAAAACDGALIGSVLAFAAVQTWSNYRRSSAALSKISKAPSSKVSDLRSILSDDDFSAAGKLVVVRGEVQPRSTPAGKSGGALISQGSGEKSVIVQRTSTCLYSEWRGIFGWSIDLHALFAKTWKEQHSSALRTVPFVLADDKGYWTQNESVDVKLEGSTHPLPLTTVYHQLLPVQATAYSFIQAMFGHGYPVALLDEEKILPVGKEITVVGLCSWNDNGVFEIKSSHELPCFLSELTKAEIEADLAFNLKILLWSGIILGALSVGILGYAIQRNWIRFKEWRSRRRRRQEPLSPSDGAVMGSSGEVEEDLGEVPDGGLCVICLMRRRRCAFIPCGHRVCCAPCAAAVNRDASPKCPVCRQQTSNYLRIFDS